MIVRISDDALARALGADELALAFANKGHEVHRTSSWGMHWLEPLVEVDGPEGFTGYGAATLDDERRAEYLGRILHAGREMKEILDEEREDRLSRG